MPKPIQPPVTHRNWPAVTVAAFCLLAGRLGAADAAKVTFEDHVLPIFRNNCLKCHNPDKNKGDLDLTTFGAALKGGGSGASIIAGDADGSLLVKVITHASEPTMPPNSPKLPEAEVALIKRWIEGGLLERSGSKAIAAARPKVDLSLAAPTSTKPDGPPPMPENLPLDPVIRAPRGTALTGLAASPWAPLVALGAPHQVLLYNTDTLELAGVLAYPEGFPHDVKFSRNARLLLAGGGVGAKAGKVAVWDVVKGERIVTVGDELDAVLAADMSSDQKWVALGGPDRLVKIYEVKENELEHKIKKHTDWVTALEFSPDAKMLATGDRNGGLVIWEVISGQELYTLTGHKGAITAVSWRSDSGLLATASEDGTVKLWNPRDGQQARSWNAHNGGALSVRYTHDGRLVSCGRDNRLALWDGSGSPQNAFKPAVELPVRAVFSHDGKRVISVDYEGQVCVWNAADGRRLGELPMNPAPVAERIAEGAKRLAELQSALARADAGVSAAERELSSARDKLDRLNAALKAAQASKAEAEKQLKTAREAAAGPEADDAAKARVKALNEQLSKAVAELASLPKDVQAQGKLVDAARQKVAQAQQAATAAKADLEAAQASLARLKAYKPRPQTASQTDPRPALATR
jgi:mono/diheme cytochrome c family protein